MTVCGGGVTVRELGDVWYEGACLRVARHGLPAIVDVHCTWTQACVTVSAQTSRQKMQS